MSGTDVGTGESIAITTGRGGLRRLLVTIGVANAALYAMYVGVLQVLLPLQIEHIDPARKVALLGLVSGVSAIFAAVFNPLGGALSDRTRSRFGRRAPWLTGAAGGVLVALAVLGSAGSVLMVAVGWSLVQAVANLYQAALTAVVPDRVAERRRGAASGVVGVATSLGAVAGVGLAGRFTAHLAWGYLALGAVLALGAIVFVTATTDPSSAGAPRPVRERLGPLARLTRFLSALRQHDFGWVFAGRAAMILGYFLVTGFELYILTDYVRLPAGMAPATGVIILAAISTLCSILAAAIAGP
ncbi:MAG TPA: MFS transporter, partial [Streptosporangiaceae bacterium]